MLDKKLLDTLRLGFSSSIMKIKIPSLGNNNREYGFRELSVREFSTISKIILSNSDSQSTVYSSSLVLLKYLCMDKDFDPYSMNEIDRLKLLTFILSGIFFSKNLNIRCPRVGCNTEFKYSMKYGDILKKIDDITNSEFTFENETSAGKIKITASFPSARRYNDFLEFSEGIKNTPVDYESFNNSFVEIDSEKNDSNSDGKTISADDSFVQKIKKRREILKNKIDKSVADGNSLIGNVDMKRNEKKSSKSILEDISFIYIKSILITDIPNSNDDFKIDFGGLSYEDTIRIMDILPAKLFVRENGKRISSEIRSKIDGLLNSCSPEIICPTCGLNISKKIGIQNFFIHG